MVFLGGIGVAFIVYISTLVASQIAPFTLLVPIFGLISSALILGEPLPAWKLQAAALVLAGLALNIFGPRFLAPKPVSS